MSSIRLCEVGMRDGLQSIKTVMPTQAKLSWLSALYDAGLRAIEVSSFVPVKLLPQLADAAQIVAHAKTLPGLAVSVLVPNLKGAQAAFEAGVDAITVPCSASEAHSLANVHKSRQDMVDEVARIAALRNEIAPDVLIDAGISTAFGCTIQGAVDEDDVIWMMEAVARAGADTSGLADTTGMANPAQVKCLFKRAIAAVGRDRVSGAHMHNTRGLGLANCLAAFEVGIIDFDGSLAGIGGCPHAPGASGNVSTEDLAFMFEAMGVKTGLNFDKLLAAREPLQRGLPEEPLYGMLAAAGLPKNFAYA